MTKANASIKIYFAGSIRGGREMQPTYKRIIEHLQFLDYVVLSEHVGDEQITASGEIERDNAIFKRDFEWLHEADYVVADVTVPSTGVGFEIAYGRILQNKVLCIAHVKANVSAMITGNPTLEFSRYIDADDAINAVLNFIERHRKIKREIERINKKGKTK